MMTKMSVVIFVLLSFNVLCCPTAYAGQIMVEASGHASGSPDRIRVSLGVSALQADYAEALSVSSIQLEAVRSALVPVGFTSDDIRTSDFSVSAEYTHSRGDNGEYSRTFSGYRVFNNLTLDFDIDTGRLASLLSAVASSGVEPSISIALIIKDEMPLKDAALQEAARIARHRADVLASASGTQVGDLISIESALASGYAARPLLKMEAAAMNDAQAPTIVPSDIELTETAIFTWETR